MATTKTAKKKGPKMEKNVGQVKKLTISVDYETWENLYALGNKNFSRGIRDAARRCRVAIEGMKKKLRDDEETAAIDAALK
jgi:hypothetical protein